MVSRCANWSHITFGLPSSTAALFVVVGGVCRITRSGTPAQRGPGGCDPSDGCRTSFRNIDAVYVARARSMITSLVSSGEPPCWQARPGGRRWAVRRPWVYLAPPVIRVPSVTAGRPHARHTEGRLAKQNGERP